MIVEGTHSADKLKFAIIVSRFNHEITDALLEGAVDCLVAHGGKSDTYDVVRVPGAFEIPVSALKAAQTKRYDAIICLGTVIRGDTAHFEYVAGAAARGIAQVGLQTGIPAIFGVLTTDTIEDALDRARRNESNKGWEAALAAMEIARVLKQIS